MRFVSRIGLAAVLAATAGLAALAPTAAADPSLYDPEIFPCEHLFRTPWGAVEPNTATYWSPFGTSGIVCYDNGTGMADFYQRDLLFLNLNSNH